MLMKPVIKVNLFLYYATIIQFGLGSQKSSIILFYCTPLKTDSLLLLIHKFDNSVRKLFGSEFFNYPKRNNFLVSYLRDKFPFCTDEKWAFQNNERKILTLYPTQNLRTCEILIIFFCSHQFLLIPNFLQYNNI